MAKGQEYSRYQTGIINRYFDNRDTIMLQKAGELVSELYLCTDEKKRASLWKSVHDALKKTPADGMKVGRIIAERNVEALAKLITELSNAKPQPSKAATPAAASIDPTPTAPAAPIATPAAIPAQATPAAPPAPSAPPAPLSEHMLNSALALFKKRLKLVRLDEESKISARALSAGKKSAVVAIQPPHQHPRAVWDELVKQGKLRYAGSGMYELVG